METTNLNRIKVILAEKKLQNKWLAEKDGSFFASDAWIERLSECPESDEAPRPVKVTETIAVPAVPPHEEGATPQVKPEAASDVRAGFVGPPMPLRMRDWL